VFAIVFTAMSVFTAGVVFYVFDIRAARKITSERVSGLKPPKRGASPAQTPCP
jgi:hypothetical protein